jgi:hypothetical protein
LPWWRWPQRVTFRISSELSIKSAKKLVGEREKKDFGKVLNGESYKGVSDICGQKQLSDQMQNTQRQNICMYIWFISFGNRIDLFMRQNNLGMKYHGISTVK